MEFVNEINEKENRKPKHKPKAPLSSLEIGFVRYKNGDVSFELKDVKVRDVDTLREFFWELVDELEKNK